MKEHLLHAAGEQLVEVRPGRAPGKRTLTMGLAPSSHAAGLVQQKEGAAPARTAAAAPFEDPFSMHLISGPVQLKANGDRDEDQVHAAAARGIEGAGTSLPFLDQIQASFGAEHDVSHVQAHVGGAATEASAAMGATAYATSNHVAFAGAPDLHTAAHEAAHVVQQRAGVALKGGVGQQGDAYERHADAVADAVVAGRPAAPLLSELTDGGGTTGVQRQEGGGPAASPTVDVTVTWSSPFGNNLTGTVTLYGRANDEAAWRRIESQHVADANTATFPAATRYRYYKAEIHPVDDVKDDDQAVGKFKKTKLTSGSIAATSNSATIHGRLELNRWNRDNVEQRHDREGIDAEASGEDDTRSVPLFGRSVQVHRLIVDRVARTEALYQALTTSEKQRIGASLFVAGGYAYRNQTGKAGAFSNHSVGMAIDVNYNEGKLQNALMETDAELEVLNKLVQPVVRTDPALAAFDIWTAQGQEQLRASRVFNDRFPRFLAELMGRSDDVTALDRAAAGAFGGIASKARAAADLFNALTAAEVSQAAATQHDTTKKKQLELIAANWESLKAWIFGAKVRDKREHADKTAYGMIPLDEKVLQMFLDTGWEWGGNWRGGTRKDYMHFEDPTLLDQIRNEDH